MPLARRLARFLSLGAWCGLMCIASCATDQRTDINSYRAVSDPPGVTPTHDPGAPLSLNDALRLTAAYNELLAIQGEDYVQALAARQRAAAALLPTIDLFAGIGIDDDAEGETSTQTDFGLGGQYRVLTGLGDLRNISAADASARARQWLILDLRESLLLQAALAYYDTLRAERLASVLTSSVEAQLARLEDARARNEAGLARPLDVGQIEAQVSRTRTLLISAERQAAEARATLSLLTHAEVHRSELTDGFDALPTERELHELLTLARHHRQDIVAARADANAARQIVDAAISQYAPTITLNLDYFLARVPDKSASMIASLIQLRVPIFSAGVIEADIRAAWSQFRQRVLEYQLQIREARRDVETAFAQVTSSRALARELEAQVAVARQTLLLAEASYEAGLGTNLERVTAQDQLLTAQLEAASEEFTTKTATLALHRACGLLASELIGAPLPVAPPEDPEPLAPLLERSAPVEDSPSKQFPGAHG